MSLFNVPSGITSSLNILLKIFSISMFNLCERKRRKRDFYDPFLNAKKIFAYKFSSQRCCLLVDLHFIPNDLCEYSRKKHLSWKEWQKGFSLALNMPKYFSSHSSSEATTKRVFLWPQGLTSPYLNLKLLLNLELT